MSTKAIQYVIDAKDQSGAAVASAKRNMDGLATAARESARQAALSFQEFVKATNAGGQKWSDVRLGMLGGVGWKKSFDDHFAERRGSMDRFRATAPDSPEWANTSRMDMRAYRSAMGNDPSFRLGGMAKAAGAVAAAIEAIDIATDVWNGDITVAAETIKALPFGIGHVATVLESVLGKWTGATEEIKRNNEQAQALEKSYKSIAAAAAAVKSATGAMGDRLRSYQEGVADFGLSGSEASVRSAERNLQANQRAVVEARKKTEEAIDAELVKINEARREASNRNDLVTANAAERTARDLEKKKRALAEETNKVLRGLATGYSEWYRKHQDQELAEQAKRTREAAAERIKGDMNALGGAQRMLGGLRGDVLGWQGGAAKEKDSVAQEAEAARAKLREAFPAGGNDQSNQRAGAYMKAMALVDRYETEALKRIDEDEKQKKDDAAKEKTSPNNMPTSVQAYESRFLTRGPITEAPERAAKAAEKTEKHSAASADMLKEINTLMGQIAAFIQQDDKALAVMGIS